MKKQPTYHQSEHEVQDQIIQYLRIKQIFHWRNNVGRKHNLYFGLKGSGDILGITPNGIFFSIEVKDYKGQQSKEQERFQKDVEDNNGIYILARDIEDVVDIL